MAGFLSSTCSITRFRVIDEVSDELLLSVPDKFKQFAFQDIDDIPQESTFGWVNFDDMLDTAWRLSPPEKGEYITFSFRMDTRRISPAVLKKHLRVAIEEETKKMRDIGKKFISRQQKLEIREQVMLRLRGRAMPVPEEFQVVWNPQTGSVYLATTKGKVIDLFCEYFTRTLDLHLEQLAPYSLACNLLGEEAALQIDHLEPAQFVNQCCSGGSTDGMLGQEFLTWLWYQSDTAPGAFTDSEGSPFAVSMEQRIVVQGGEGESIETATVSGVLSSLREAKLGLLTGKKVVQALARIEKDGMAWQSLIKAEDFSIGSLRSPSVERDPDSDDMDALFLEKAYLVDLYLDMLDDLYRQFLHVRLAPAQWSEEEVAVGKWITTSTANTVSTATL